MDANRFAALLRSLSASPSRRTVLGLLAGSAVGRLGVLDLEDADAHNTLKKCEQIEDTDRRNRCRRKAKRHKRQHQNEPPCSSGCPVCQQCDPATGRCVPGNHGGVCGIQSEPRGGAIRCCNGTCPDPDCRPAGHTGIACASPGDCLDLNCCPQQPVISCSTTCYCVGSEADEPCGSDRDCEAGTPATACICGTCQVPPA